MKKYFNERMENDFMKINFLDKLNEVSELQYQIDKKRSEILIAEISLTENEKILIKEELPELQDIAKRFRKDLYRTKSTVRPLIIKKIRDSLKYNPNFSATDISKRLSVSVITIVKADLDLELGISTDAQKEAVTNKVLLYSVIERLRDGINQMEDRSVKDISNKFGIAVEHLEEIEKYYELGIMLDDFIEQH